METNKNVRRGSKEPEKEGNAREKLGSEKIGGKQAGFDSHAVQVMV